MLGRGSGSFGMIIQVAVTPRIFRVRAGSSGPPQPYLLPGLFSLSLSHFLSPPDRAERSSLTPAPRPSPAVVRRFLPQGPPQPRPAPPPHLSMPRLSSSPPESALHRWPPWERRPSSHPIIRSAQTFSAYKIRRKL